MDEYFVLYCGEGGSHLLKRYTKPELEQALADGDFGPDIPLRHVKDSSQIDLDSIHGLFIFKGTCVVPQPKTVVTAWAV